MKKTLLAVRMKRLQSILLVLCTVLLSMAACTNGQNSEGTFDTADDINSETPDSVYDIIDYDDETDYNLLDEMRAETLLYPSQNDEWKYNVYNTYIELTEYIGESVTELIVPEEIDGLPVKAYSVKKLYIPSTIVSVKLPSTIVIIGKHSFGVSLKSINLPKGLIEIGDNAFSGCEQLSDIELPSTLKKIGEEAFQNCYSIKSVTIPASIEEIGSRAFVHCNNLEKVTVLNANISLDNSGISDNSSISMIYGYIGSTAAAYAAKKGIAFKVIEE